MHMAIRDDQVKKSFWPRTLFNRFCPKSNITKTIFILFGHGLKGQGRKQSDFSDSKAGLDTMTGPFEGRRSLQAYYVHFRARGSKQKKAKPFTQWFQEIVKSF